MSAKDIAQLGAMALETGLGRAAVAEIKQGALAVAERAGLKLSQEATEVGMAGALRGEVKGGLATESKGTIRTFSDMVRGEPGETVTAVPRRFITGSAENGITPRTVSVDVLHPDELFERIAMQKVNANLFGKRTAEGIVDKRLHYLISSEAREQTHVTLSLGNRIAGIGGVRTNRSNPAELWVDHVSVDPKHGGKGFARNIIESIYDYALRREQQVVPSSFSPQGQRLKHIFEEMNLRHPQAASNQPFRDLGK